MIEVEKIESKLPNNKEFNEMIEYLNQIIIKINKSSDNERKITVIERKHKEIIFVPQILKNKEMDKNILTCWQKPTKYSIDILVLSITDSKGNNINFKKRYTTRQQMQQTDIKNLIEKKCKKLVAEYNRKLISQNKLTNV